MQNLTSHKIQSIIDEINDTQKMINLHERGIEDPVSSFMNLSKMEKLMSA